MERDSRKYNPEVRVWPEESVMAPMHMHTALQQSGGAVHPNLLTETQMKHFPAEQILPPCGNHHYSPIVISQPMWRLPGARAFGQSLSNVMWIGESLNFQLSAREVVQYEKNDCVA
jgi:hypothetical protein